MLNPFKKTAGGQRLFAPRETHFDDGLESRSLPNATYIPALRELIREGHSATIVVRGRSMRLFLEDMRDKVTVSPVHPDEIRVRDVVLAEVSPSVFVLHRVIHRTGNRLVLKGDGNVAGTEKCTTADVIGRATAFYRKGRTKPDSANGVKFRAYSRIWLMLTPVRRYLLAFYRLVWLRIFPPKTYK